MKKHNHKWVKDPYDWGYCCRCGGWKSHKRDKDVCYEGLFDGFIMKKGKVYKKTSKK